VTPGHELELLRELSDAVAPPTPQQRGRARARLLAAVAADPREGSVVHLDAPATAVVPRRPSRRSPPTAVPGRRWGRLAGSLAATLVLGAVFGTVWSTRPPAPPTPVIGRVGTSAAPDGPLPIETHPAVDYRDVPPLAADGVTATVTAPTTPGPWPVVVLTSGHPGEAFEPMARSLAEHGAVVYLARTHVIAHSITRPGIEEGEAATACLLRYVTETASRYGGSADRLVAVGYGVDAWTGLLAALRGDVDAAPCAVSGSSPPPIAFVALDGGLPCAGLGCPFLPITGTELDPFEHVGERPEVAVHVILPSHGPSFGGEDAYGPLVASLRAAGHEATATTLTGASPGDLYLPEREASREVVARVAALAHGGGVGSPP
jgi:hypothetical protein